jgi:hypothetical protein
VHPLDGARLKINRAQEHLHAVDAQVVEFLTRDPKPYRLIPKVDTEGAKKISRVFLEVDEQPPVSIGVVVGDCIHNARSALEYVTFELTEALSLSANARRRIKPQFPLVRENAHTYRRKGLPYVAHLPGWQRAVIRKLQPYQRGDTANDHPLALLNSISNRDKHRLLQVTVAQVNTASAKIWGADVRALYDLWHHVGPVDIGQTELLRAVYELDDPTAEHPDVNMQGNMDIDVGLPNGHPVRPVLAAIIDAVESIVDWFAPAL